MHNNGFVLSWAWQHKIFCFYTVMSGFCTNRICHLLFVTVNCNQFRPKIKWKPQDSKWNLLKKKKKITNCWFWLGNRPSHKITTIENSSSLLRRENIYFIARPELQPKYNFSTYLQTTSFGFVQWRCDTIELAKIERLSEMQNLSIVCQ